MISGSKPAQAARTFASFEKCPWAPRSFRFTKICDAGLDYTNRTNYLAHHLVLDGFEIATSPSPAEIFLNWDGWLRTWTDGPRYLGEEEAVTLTGYLQVLGWFACQSWLQVTNDPGNAASLVSPEVIKPIVLESKEGNPNTLLTLLPNQLCSKSASMPGIFPSPPFARQRRCQVVRLDRNQGQPAGFEAGRHSKLFGSSKLVSD